MYAYAILTSVLNGNSTIYFIYITSCVSSDMPKLNSVIPGKIQSIKIIIFSKLPIKHKMIRSFNQQGLNLRLWFQFYPQTDSNWLYIAKYNTDVYLKLECKIRT